jgi:endoglucanase
MILNHRRLIASQCDILWKNSLNGIYLNMRNRSFLDTLIESDSVSGNEFDACQIVEKSLQGVTSIRKDSIGNLYAEINSDKQYKILLEAHIDEIGFQVNYIDGDGYIYLRSSGGVDLITTIGHMVCIRNRKGDKIFGVVGKKPIHLLKGDERTRIPDSDGIWVDAGLNSEATSNLISVGDYVCIHTEHKYIGENKLVGKGLDNKLGVYAISEAIRELALCNLANVSVTAIFSTQEEVGCKGATVAALRNEFDEIISVDTTFTSDVPDISPKIVGDIKLGSGPVVFKHSDVCRNLADEIISNAHEMNIQVSANYAASGGTDIRPLQLSSNKARSALIGIPLRYMHTPVEMCDVRDVEDVINLIVAYIKSK